MTPVAPSHCGRLRLSALLLLAALFATLPACSAYNLQGKVIDGPASQITIVDAGDPRLDQPGLAGASIETMLESSTSHVTTGSSILPPAPHATRFSATDSG